ncbi:MAG: hypothetical protein DSZ33_06600 [Gammaproteobacteria bacterium]|nr:MAG: hypothetical protein DSZ33_06600 [Gammaproteobacteria bacterium]
MLDSDDLQTVADGAPAYLILLDSFLLDSPDDPSMLLSASGLYGAYSGVFITDKRRAARMNTKAMNYALHAVCVSDQAFCDLQTEPFDRFSSQVATLTKNDVPAWYTLGTAWAGWIQAHSSDLKAVAQLPRVRIIMERIAELDPAWQQGGAYLYLGVLSTLLPPALGGKPELGKQYFESAMRQSDGKNLMAKVLYAEKYARLVFDQPLHDRLLNEVLASDPHAEGLTLMNTLAQKKAAELLKSGKEYF